MDSDLVNELIFPFSVKYEFDKKNFVDPKLIASGRHVVRSYLYTPLEMRVAVKEVCLGKSRRSSSNDTMERLKKELHSIRTLGYNDNIINFFGVCTFDQNTIWLCMELLDFSLKDLYLTISRNDYNISQFPENILGCIAVSVLDALHYCEKQHVMHRDIKPDTILFKRSGEIKLSGFGESRVLENSLLESTVGTIAYWAPERITIDAKYDIKADVWSYGITLAEVIYGDLPYTPSDGTKLTSNFLILQSYIKNAKASNIIEKCLGHKYTPDLKHFLLKCLQPWEERANFSELKKMDFYTNNNKLSRNDRIKEVKGFLDNYNLMQCDTEEDSENSSRKEDIYELLPDELAYNLKEVLRNAQKEYKENIERRISQIIKKDSDEFVRSKHYINMLKSLPLQQEAKKIIGISPVLICGPYDKLNEEMATNLAKLQGLKFSIIDMKKIDHIKVLVGSEALVDGLPGKIVNGIRSENTINLAIIFTNMDMIDMASYPLYKSRKLYSLFTNLLNKSFEDSYLGFPLDLSGVYFMFVANDMDKDFEKSFPVVRVDCGKTFS